VTDCIIEKKSFCGECSRVILWTPLLGWWHNDGSVLCADAIKDDKTKWDSQRDPFYGKKASILKGMEHLVFPYDHRPWTQMPAGR
jgi:hypothetical protein